MSKRHGHRPRTVNSPGQRPESTAGHPTNPGLRPGLFTVCLSTASSRQSARERSIAPDNVRSRRPVTPQTPRSVRGCSPFGIFSSDHHLHSVSATKRRERSIAPDNVRGRRPVTPRTPHSVRGCSPFGLLRSDHHLLSVFATKHRNGLSPRTTSGVDGRSPHKPRAPSGAVHRLASSARITISHRRDIDLQPGSPGWPTSRSSSSTSSSRQSTANRQSPRALTNACINTSEASFESTSASCSRPVVRMTTGIS